VNRRSLASEGRSFSSSVCCRRAIPGTVPDGTCMTDRLHSNVPCGTPTVDVPRGTCSLPEDNAVIGDIFVLNAGAPANDLPDDTTCKNRCARAGPEQLVALHRDMQPGLGLEADSQCTDWPT